MSEIPDPESWGIAPGHHHVRGEWVPSPERGVDAALAAMGADDWAPPVTPTWVISRNWGLHVPFAADLHTEDGGDVRVSGHVPREALPLGYHWLEPAGGGERVRLIVSPGVCPLPRRTWGWAVQLYAARSRDSWGMGDLGDLRRLAGWSASAQGGGMLLTNPIHAVAPTPGQQTSPYYPSSRRWRNPIYLRIEDIPGLADLAIRPAGLEDLARAGRALNRDRRIDRDEVWRLKRAALEEVWAQWRKRPAAGDGSGFDRWMVEQDSGLVGFATWSALADSFGPDWRSWPDPYRHPGATAVAEWSREHWDRIRFHCWLQWLVDVQLAAAASTGPALVSDLAIGADPAGADAWQGQDVLAPGVSIGAPPDEFSPGGQDWGLPPFDPWRLRAAAYEPFAQIVRAAVAAGGGVRVDHVAGLFRLFWVPEGESPVAGVYVRYPWEDLLNVLALEADRAGAFVVGEDLGTVEPEAREALAARHILSYRLLWFEERLPTEWPELALAAVTTHDLPTVSGVWTGADLARRREIGLTVDEKAELGLQDKLRWVVGAPSPLSTDPSGAGEESMSATEVVRRAYEALAEAPSLLVAATLDDALGVDERPNQPGTIDQWPNWSIALPLALEDIEEDPHVKAVAQVLGRHRGRRA
ncbi:MAG: 4-alpha-glucanotransferase [Acidimicrobiales bacterium]